MKKKNWLVALMSVMMVGGIVGCADDSGKTNDVPQNEDDQKPVEVKYSMTVDPTAVNMDVNTETTLTVTYKADDKGKQGVKLETSALPAGCVTVDSANTDANGTARIVVKSGAQACGAAVTIKDKSGNTPDVQVGVIVSDPEHPEDKPKDVEYDPKIVVKSPANGIVPLDKKDDTKDVIVVYYDKTGKPSAETNIVIGYVEPDDKDCVSANSNNIETDKNGEAKVTLTAKDENCTAGITFTVENAKASVAANVGEAPDILASFAAYFYGPGNSQTFGSRAQEVRSVELSLVKSCPASADDMDDAEITYYVNDVNALSNPIASLSNKKVQKSWLPIYLAGVAKDADGYAIGFGCSETALDKSGNGSTLTVDIHEDTINMAGEYSVVANFDLTSGFAKTSEDGLPPVEKMIAGDWIQFVVDFCNKPIDALFDFIWANTVIRFKDMDVTNANDTIKTVVNLLKGFVNDGTKTLAKGYVDSALDKYLVDMNWYTILTQVSGDVADLTTNMQLVGKLTMGSQNISTITGVNEKYTSLQYQWSLNKTGCINDAYGKVGVCRREMPLAAKNNAIEGRWDGSIAPSASSKADAFLNINEHGLTFKWATILYTAVFSEILPNALGYAQELKSKLDQGLYITAFMNGVLFKPIVNYYATKCVGYEKCGDETKPAAKVCQDEGKVGAACDDNCKKCTQVYPEVKDVTVTTDANNEPVVNYADSSKLCEYFIQSLLYLVWQDASTNTIAQAAVSFVAPYACGENGLGKLDSLVIEQLEKLDSKVDSTGTGAFKMSANDCPLHADKGLYTSIGAPDPGYYTANEIVTGKEETSRCPLNVTIPGINNAQLKGYFHGVDTGNK